MNNITIFVHSSSTTYGKMMKKIESAYLYKNLKLRAMSNNVALAVETKGKLLNSKNAFGRWRSLL